MSRAGFQKSVRMFHKFSQETARRRGGDATGRESIEALGALDAVLKAERLLTGDLLEPLAAFTNLLQSSQLPPEFGDYSFGDALLAIEEAHAERRQHDAQRWEFAPELDTEPLPDFLPEPAEPEAGDAAAKLEGFVGDAVEATAPKSVLIVGALREPALPLAKLCARCERITLNDLDLPRLEAQVRDVVPEAHRARVQLERYDATGSYVAFAAGVQAAVEGATSLAEAEHELLRLLESYDVGAGSAGLSAREDQPDLAISAQLLPQLGAAYPRVIRAALAKRGWEASAAPGAPLWSAVSLLRCLVEQHHIQALLRRAKSAVLVSPVSEVRLKSGPGGKDVAASEPRDLLSVERLVERLPASADVKAEQSWEQRRGSTVTLIEAVRL
jgi:hypothetical protein